MYVSKRTKSSDAPFVFQTIALVLTWAFVIWLAWTAYERSGEVEGHLRRHIRVEEVYAEIQLQDEIATMSCYMAAATGEPRWQARYSAHAARRQAALAAAEGLSPTMWREHGLDAVKL